MQHYRRKPVILLGTLSLFFILMIVSAAGYSGLKALLIVGLFVYILVFNLSMSAGAYTYMVELVPKELIFIPIISHWVFTILIG
jgi:hypothetical protein